MFLIAKLLIGAIMITITVVIHAATCDFAFRFIENHPRSFARLFKKFWKIWSLIVAVFMIGSALMVDIWLWTALFYTLEPKLLGDIETALYFTTASFTTVGYGDIVFPPDWRLLTATAAINGMIIFGWSTAFIFEIMTALYKPTDRKRIHHDRSEKNH